MVDLNPYGREGCTCFRDEVDVSGADGFAQRIPGRWLPNAACRFHGALAPWAPPRRDTGTYQVVLPEPGPELVPWPTRPGSLEWFAEERARRDAARTTTEEEHGVLAAVRRWARRWLPRTAHYGRE